MKRIIWLVILLPFVFAISCKKDNKPTPGTAPKAFFGADTTYIFTGDSIHFIDSSLNVPSSWLWILSGSHTDTSRIQSPWIRYDSAGTFSVRLIVRNEWGTDTLLKTDFIHVTLAPQPFHCGTSLTDSRDSKTYSTIKIGGQCWMAQNLKIGTMVNSTSTSASHSNVSNNSLIEKYCYDNLEANCTANGGLYDWNEMMGYSNTAGTQGICPTGWHLPTDAEWTTLLNAVSNDGLTLMQAAGFNSLLAGARSSDGYFFGNSTDSYFWTSTFSAGNMAYSRNLHTGSSAVLKSSFKYTYGYSVRCINDGFFVK